MYPCAHELENLDYVTELLKIFAKRSSEFQRLNKYSYLFVLRVAGV